MCDNDDIDSLNCSTNRELSIAEMQQEIIDAGWQYCERIFSDGMVNCSIKFARSKNPMTFEDESLLGDCGWGRYDRDTAWKKAYQAIIVEGKF